MGELRDRRRLATCRSRPGSAACSCRSLIFLAFNAGRASAHGWGAAMSTDTAFALGMLALVGRGLPERLRAFMLTVAVVDDMIALIVIATVYTEHVHVRALLVGALLLRGDRRAIAARTPPRRALRRARPWGLGRDAEVGRRPGRRRARAGACDLRVPGRARRPRARHRAVPAVSRAADARARPLGPRRPGRRAVAQRAPAAALPPVDELRDRAAVRARQRRHRDQRELPLARVHVADHARDPGRVRGRQAGRRSPAPRWLVTRAEPRPAAATGRLGSPSPAAARSPASASRCRC